jgi:hypothetical protein
MAHALAGASNRNYPALFLALDAMLEAMAEGCTGDEALSRSFDGSADGFGAAKAVLLIVERNGTPGLRAVASRGLSWQEVAACESGLSVPGVSSTCIREALTLQVPVLVQDPQRLLGVNVSEVLRLRPCSVLCAPALDPRTGETLAVFYVQNEGLRNAFGEIDRAWVEVYARALGRALAGAPTRPSSSEVWEDSQ